MDRLANSPEHASQGPGNSDKGLSTGQKSFDAPAFQLKASTVQLDKDKKPKPKKKKTIEEKIAGLANEKAALIALAELKVKKANDKKARLTQQLMELLVMGVAKPMNTDSDLGAEGIIGIHHANNAADALIGMEMLDYSDVVMKLNLTGGDNVKSDKFVEKILILKAVGARKDKYISKDASAKSEVGDFAKDIRNMDADTLKEMTSLRDHGGGDGLQQKYTMSCGPTSIQIVYGESDPVFALDVSKKAKHTLDYNNDVGDQQAKWLDKSSMIPRKVMDKWNSFKGYVNGLVIPPGDVPKWQALLAYIQGDPFDAGLKAQGEALAGVGGYTATDIQNFNTHFPFSQPGMTVPDYQKALTDSDVDDVTGSTHTLHQFNKTSNPVKDSDLDDVWKELFRGRDVPVGVFWSGGGGHYMVFTQAKGDPPTGGGSREFLLSDPWEGTSEWLSNDDVKNGNFGTFGSGYIDDIYW